MKKDIPRVGHQQTLAMIRPEPVKEENLLDNLLEGVVVLVIVVVVVVEMPWWRRLVDA